MKLAIVAGLLLVITSVATVFAQAKYHYENTFCMQRRCPYDGYIRCKSTGRCINPQSICNGYDNCQDGSDEENCGPTFNGCRGFLCDNRTRCLSNSLVCNGYKYCSDGSDEANCLTGACPYDDDIKCNDTGRCLRSTVACNGYSSCSNGDDEANCDSRPCLYESDFRCGDGLCIRSDWVCNRYNNCRDGSDEINCAYDCPYNDDILCNSNCYREHQFCYGGQRCSDVNLNCSLQSCPYDDDFRCSNGGCVRSYDVCSGFCECSDCSDEENCTSKSCYYGSIRARYFLKWCPLHDRCAGNWYACQYCGYNSVDGVSRCFDCRNSTRLTDYVFECDGINDCEDGNDELNCYNQICLAADDFRCATTGACIRKVQVCDGRQHCSDNSDEENCLFRNCTIPGDVKCRDNGSCIHSDMICNGISDCMDGSDEENCSAKPCPFPGDLRCNSSQACIRYDQWCNNQIDCDDGSDEDNCYNIPCPYNGDFRCTYGGGCIRERQVCNGHEQCPDGSDEGMNYCPEDFTLGLLWERSLTKTTYKHKCSDIHPSFKFADTITRDCLKNRTWAAVNISQCVMDSDSPVIMIVIINLSTNNSSLVKLRQEKITEEAKKMIIEHPAVHIDILQSTVDVSLKMTYEFSTLTVNELVEVINYEMTLTTLGNISVSNVPQLTIFDSTDACQCPNTINSTTIPVGVSNTESIEILSVCSGKPCDDSCSNYSNCKCTDQFVGNGVICGKDSDGDGYPDMMLDCDGPHCVQDNCPTVHNPSQNQVCNDSPTNADDEVDYSTIGITVVVTLVISVLVTLVIVYIVYKMKKNPVKDETKAVAYNSKLVTDGDSTIKVPKSSCDDESYEFPDNLEQATNECRYQNNPNTSLQPNPVYDDIYETVK